MTIKSTVKKTRGRPEKENKSTEVRFVLPPPAASYLLSVGKRLGWGDSIHSISKAMVMSRYIEMQTSLFHEKAMPTAEIECDEDETD